jgi:8-oxo-dGTP diphosphatase
MPLSDSDVAYIGNIDDDEDDYRWLRVINNFQPEDITQIPTWPAWQHDQNLAALYAPKIATAFATGMAAAEAFLAQVTAGEVRVTPTYAAQEVSRLLAASLRGALSPLWMEGYALGAMSARHAVQNLPQPASSGDSASALITKLAGDPYPTPVTGPDWHGWQPGDLDAAAKVATGSRLTQLLQQWGINIISAVSQTKLGDLAQLIASALADGDSAGKLAKDITGLLNVPSRAKMIAQTEITRASTAASLDTYLDMGVSTKEILVAPDERVCKVCRAAEAEGPIPLQQPFNNGLDGPGFHPNCRCAVTAASVGDFDLSDMTVEPLPGFNLVPLGKSFNPLELRGLHGEWTKDASATGHDAHAVAIQRDKLPEDENYALDKYMSSSYIDINRSLRNGTTPPEETSLIDRAMNRGKLSMPITVHRGIKTAKGREATFGAGWQDRDLTGFTWHEKGFSSTSAALDPHDAVFINPAVTHLITHVPAGIAAISMSPATSTEDPGEDEILLDRDLQYTITHDYGLVNGQRTLDVSVSPVIRSQVNGLNGVKVANKEHKDAVTCDHGHRHLGAYGAAGILIRAPRPSGELAYLLQQRSADADCPGKWSVFGGSLHEGETPLEGATREVNEEVGTNVPSFTAISPYADDHGGWAYTTFLADAPATFWPAFDGETPEESANWGWFTLEEMKNLKLHPGFKASLPKILAVGTEKTAVTDLVKVGPKGYIHGWVKVDAANTSLSDYSDSHKHELLALARREKTRTWDDSDPERDRVMDRIAAIQGFDAKPSHGALDPNRETLYRGFGNRSRGGSDGEDQAHQFTSGEYRAGEGNYASGIFATPRRDRAEGYSTHLLQMQLHPDAKIAKGSDLEDQAEKLTSDWKEIVDGDPGRLGALLGYDAVGGFGTTRIILNRGALRVDNTTEKALHRQVELNGQETWEDVADQQPPAAGGGAMSMPPVPGGVPGFTAGGEPPRWDGSSPQPRVLSAPDDEDDADYPQGRTRSERPHAFPSGPQGMDGYWPDGNIGTMQSPVSSPGGARGVPPSTVGKRFNPLEPRGKHGEWEKINGFTWVEPAREDGLFGKINHPDHGNGFVSSVDTDGTQHVEFADGFSGVLGSESRDYGDSFKIIEPGSDADKELSARPDGDAWRQQLARVQSSLDSSAPSQAAVDLINVRDDRLKAASALGKRISAARAQVSIRLRAGASSSRPLSLASPDHALVDKPSKPFVKLTDGEKNALDAYTRPITGGAEIWNPALRENDIQQLAAVQGDIAQVDSAISKSWAKKDTIAYRGMSLPAGMKLEPGHEFTDSAFGSVTDREEIAHDFAYARAGMASQAGSHIVLSGMKTSAGTPALLKISIPRGYNLAKGDSGIKEHILPRGTRYRVTGIDPNGTVNVDVIPWQ